MELVAGLFAAGGAAGTGAAAAGTAAAAGSAIGFGSTALSVLQGVATAGSALMSISAGASQARAEDRASQLEALRIQREELQKVGKMRVAFAGSGVDISSGQAASLEQSVRDQSDFEQGLVRTRGRIRAQSARLSGFGKAFGTASGGLIDIARRG